jgi:hypothetical protein
MRELFIFRPRCDDAAAAAAAGGTVDKVIAGLFVILFFIGCAYVGWTAGRAYPLWLVLFFLSLAALVILDRRR